MPPGLPVHGTSLGQAASALHLPACSWQMGEGVGPGYLPRFLGPLFLLSPTKQPVLGLHSLHTGPCRNFTRALSRQPWFGQLGPQS